MKGKRKLKNSSLRLFSFGVKEMEGFLCLTDTHVRSKVSGRMCL